MQPVNMAPAAVTARLRRVDELRDLCRALAGPRLKYPFRTTAEREAATLLLRPAMEKRGTAGAEGGG